MDIQDKITLLLETAVRSILHETGIHHGDYCDQDKQKLRIQFDAELSFQCGDISNGDHDKLINKHMIF